MFKIRDKKGTIGATMTWIVATIIILFVIVFFIYASYSLAQQNLFDLDFKKQHISNINTKQTLLGLLQTKLQDKSVEDYILAGEYSVIEGDVNLILEELEMEDLRAEIYLDSKKVILDKDGLGVE